MAHRKSVSARLGTSNGMKLLVALVAALGIVSAGADLIRNHEDLSAEKIKILVRIGEFTAAFNEHDWDTLSQIFDDSKEVLFTQGDDQSSIQLRAKGRAEIKKLFSVTPSIQKTTMYTRVTHMNVDEDDGTAATTADFFYISGEEIGSGRSRQMWVKRDDGVWYITSESTTTKHVRRETYRRHH